MRLKKEIKNTKESIQCPDEEELDIFECISRNIAQQEDLLRWSKKQSGKIMRMIVFLSLLGSVVIPLAIKLNVYRGHNIEYIFIVLVLFVLAGMALWVYRTSLLQVGEYRNKLYEEGQLWTIVGLVSKTKDEKKEIDSELYSRIIESEIRKREKLAFSKEK